MPSAATRTSAHSVSGGTSTLEEEASDDTPKKVPGRPLNTGALGKGIKLHRLHVKLNDRGLERLEKIQMLTQAVSAADVIRDALRVYEALVEEVSAGNNLILESPSDPAFKKALRLF